MNGFKDFRIEDGPSQVQNLALTGLRVLRSEEEVTSLDGFEVPPNPRGCVASPCPSLGCLHGCSDELPLPETLIWMHREVTHRSQVRGRDTVIGTYA